jgi:hypothetical protein
MIKAEERLGPIILNHKFVQALINDGGLSQREAFLVFIDQQVQSQNWVNTFENPQNQSPNSLSRMHAGIRQHYKSGYGRLFWIRQREVRFEELPVAYIENILAA